MIRAELIKKKFSIMLSESKYCIHDLRVSLSEDDYARQIFASFSMLCEKVQDVTISHPHTWWDAFRMQFFPSWINERFPPRFAHHRVSVFAVLPKFNIALPDEEYFFHVYHTKEVSDG